MAVDPNYMRIPSLGTYVMVTTNRNGGRQFLCVTVNDDVSYYFTRDGKKLTEIWNTRYGESVSYTTKGELDVMTKHYFSKEYHEKVLPSVDRFLAREKRLARSSKG